MTNLKIIQKSEIEFVGDRGSRALVDIQIGNSEFQIGLNLGIDAELRIDKPQKLEHLESTIGEFDYSEIEKKYRQLVADLENVRAEKLKADLTEKWENHWAQGSDFKHPKVELLIEDLDNYLERATGRYADPQALLKYKDQRVSVVYENVSRERWDKKMKYGIDHRITNFKRRNYATLENCADKVVELVDQSEDEQRRKEKQEKEAEEKRQKTLARLKALFGEVAYDRRWKHRRYGDGYYYDRYDLVKGERKFRIEEPSGTNLAESEDPESEVFYFAGLGKLSVKQIREILSII